MSLDAIVNAIASGFAQFSIVDALDIAIIAVLLYKIIDWTKETRAYQVIKGIAVLFLCAAASQLLSLSTVSWVLDSIVKNWFIVVLILFQPELRRMLEHIGRGKIFDRGLFSRIETTSTETIDELHRAVLNLASRQVGALIVIEQRTGLGDIVTTGTKIDAIVSAALLENTFEPNTPLHDGAVIIRDNRVAAAGCLLPLSDDHRISRELGTRHRAALGVSTVSDSVTIVVSEETGVISVAREGRLIRYLDSKSLKDTLNSIFLAEKKPMRLNLKKKEERNG